MRTRFFICFLLLAIGVSCFTAKAQRVINPYIGAAIDTSYLQVRYNEAADVDINIDRVSAYAVVDTSFHRVYDTIVEPEVKLPAVGCIPYTATVSTSGKTLIEVPINALSTDFETDPKISVVYNSSNELEILGRGWTLNGLSVITKTPRNYFTDGNIAGISSDDNVYSLDGQRLVVVEESDTAILMRVQTGNIYVSHDIDDDIFWVFYPDGSIGRHNVTDGANYYRSRLTYNDGRYISYTLSPNYAGGRKLVSSIGYGEGKRMNLDYYVTVDTLDSYVAGQRYRYYSKLKSISILNSSDSLLTKYTFGYNSSFLDGGVSRITQSFGDGTPLNPLCFTYYHPNAGAYNNCLMSDSIHLSLYYNDMSNNHVIVSRGKFNLGSEDDSFIFFPNKNPYCVSSHYVHNEYSGNDLILVGSSPKQSKIMMLQPGTGFIDAFAMDVNNEGVDEVVRVNNYVQSNTEYLTIQAFSYTSPTLTPSYSYQETTYPALTYKWGKTVRPRSFLCGDFDGDGRNDLLMICSTNPFGVYAEGEIKLIDLEHGVVKYQSSIEYNVDYPRSGDSDSRRWERFKASDRLLVADYNGDGKQELGIVNDNGLDFYSFSFSEINQNVIMCHDTHSDFPSLSDLTDYAIHIGDFNSDGNGDVLLTLETQDLQPYQSCAKVYLGKGDGTFAAKSRLPLTSTFYGNCTIQDVNRDGTSDVVFFGNDEERHKFHVCVYEMRNGNFGHQNNLTINDIGQLVPANLYKNDNDITLMSLHNNGVAYNISYAIPYDASLLVYEMQDSYGNKTEFEYNRLFESDYYQPDYNATFPYRVVDNGMKVCSRQIRYRANENTPISDCRYIYGSAITHLQGLGLMGFDDILQGDTIRNEYTYSTFDPQNFGTPLTKSTRLSKTNFHYTTTVSNNKLVDILLQSDAKYNKATCTSDSTTYLYDSYGNLTSSSTTTDDGWAISIQTSYLNQVNATQCFIGLPLSSVTTRSKGGNSCTFGKVNTYNNNHLLTGSYSYYGDQNHKVETFNYSYDNKKRLTKVQRKPYSGQWLEKRITYKANTVNTPISITDENGITTDYKYNDLGIVLAAIPRQTQVSPPITVITGSGGDEINNDPFPTLPDIIDPIDERYIEKKTFSYDSIGRIDKIVTPDGQLTHTSLHWCDSAVLGARYYSQVTKTGAPTTIIYYNSIGQTIRQSVQRHDGEYVHTDFLYDYRGQLIRQSVPHTDDLSSWEYYTEYQYDNFNRVVSKRKYPGEWQESNIYSGRTVTTVSGGITTSRQTDALGNLISVTDAGGTILYDFNPDGTPSSVSYAGQINTTFSYDDYGRRSGITDPSAGQRTFTYDDAGNMNSITDSRGKTVTTSYNILGLPVVKNINDEMTVNYSYNDKWLLTSMSDSEGQSWTYTYDDLRRLSSVNINGFKKTIQYHNSCSNIKSVSYKLGDQPITTELYDYLNGKLWRIMLPDSTIIRRLDVANEFGLPESIYNSAMTYSLYYDDDLRVADREVTLNAGGNNSELSWQTYDYDSMTGNLLERNIDLYDDWFEYDNLNRLVSYNRNHSSMTYDNTGNIIEKSDVGSYDYDETYPYQMNYLTTSSLMVPQRDQHIVYNALQLPDTISEGPWRATFRYYGDGSRSRMVITGATSYTEARYYGNQMTTYSRINGDIEATKDVLWLAGDAYNGSAALVRNRQTDNRWHLFYAIRDNQGSIVTVTDSTGTVRQQLHYDPWGNLMDCYGTYYAVDQQPEMLLERGYTGHEHLPQFGLINMNARLYEPATARFLSPDPEVQMPDFSQNLNRYTYCLNNPLRYIDPTGMIAFTSADTTDMTDQQKQKYLDFVKFVRENDELRDFYNKLNDDYYTYYFTFGSKSQYPELSNTPAYYDSKTRTIIYSIENYMINKEFSFQGLLEEFFHMVQHSYELLNNYKTLGINVELEAKLLTAYFSRYWYMPYSFSIIYDEFASPQLFNLLNDALLDDLPQVSGNNYLMAGKQFVEHHKNYNPNDKPYVFLPSTWSNLLSPFITIK